ncbi:conserved hypothetical protein [Trichinella spiralis]|uniref:hypothetical protein n=2 Tax=Trichinella spiralis TaxID=6334 RepID=UPI0001EFED96|nr:conserved hypothetical protein [Trichinella spiralis]
MTGPNDENDDTFEFAVCTLSSWGSRCSTTASQTSDSNLTFRVDLVYLPRRGQRSGSKNSRRWRSPSRTSSGSLAPLTLYVATARSKCTNTRATTVVPNGTHESLARSSFLALRLGSSTLPNSTLRNTAILQPVLQTTYSKADFSQPTRPLVQLSYH